MAISFRYRVELEDGTDFETTADQRDVAAFEIEPYGVPFHEAAQRPFTFARYLAWHSAKRRDVTKLSWDKFTAQCVAVEAISEEIADADPGQSAASAES